MRIVVIVQTDPYKYQDLGIAHEFAKAALKKGHEIKVFLYDESVVAASEDLHTSTDKRLAEMMRDLIDRGVEVTTCGACCLFRGIAEKTLVKGSQMGGLPDLAKMTSWADRVLNFSN